MKLLITELIVFFAIASCHAQTLQLARKSDISFRNGIAYYQGSRYTGIMLEDGNGVNKLGEFENGLKKGLFVEYYPHGVKESEENYTNGVLNGTCTKWYPDGVKMSECSYSNGGLSGTSTSWNPDGKMISICNYINGGKNGESRNFSSTGKIESLEHYRSDKLDGLCEYYDINGNKMKTCHYQIGLKEGKYQEWYDNGQLKKEMNYKMDELADGKIIEYDRLGNKLNELESKNGRIISSFNYTDNIKTTYFDYDSDKKESIGKLVDGQKEGYWTEWWLNGKKKFEGNYINGIRNGEGVEYIDSGVEIWRGAYRDGKYDGKGSLYVNKIQYTGEWGKGVKNGYFTEKNQDGSTAEGQYINDLKNGTWFEKYPNGNKKLEVQYLNGKETDGYHREWYANGQMKEERKIINGQLEGADTKWFENGLQSSSEIYKNGMIADGVYIYHMDDKGYSSWQRTYSKNTLVSEYAMSGDVKDGSFNEYYANGKKKISGHYSYGKRKVEQRYGANLKTARFFRSLGSLALLSGLIYIAAITGTLQ